ncbi:MAG: LamG domain-containing protein [Phycisphaerales bacterium]
MVTTRRGVRTLGFIVSTLGVWTGLASAQPMGDDTDEFTFVILGERQPGPAAGTALVEKGVKIADWLGADLVVTIASDPEIEALSELRVPWHALPADAGADISFDHKWAHFIFMNDAGTGEGAHVTPEQAAWVRTDLASTDAEMVYLFVRDPLWRQGPSENGWDAVERVLAEDARPTCVFAASERYVRDDGRQGRVRYRSLGPTGAFTNLDYEGASFQHITQVCVRHDAESVTLIPIDETRCPTEFVGAEFAALDRFRDSDWARLEGGVRIGPAEGVESDMTIELVGQAELPLDYSAAIDAGPGWSFSQTAFRGRLDPGQHVRLTVHATAPAIGRARPDVTLTVRARYPLSFGAEQAVTRHLLAPVEVVGVEADTGGGENKALVLNGRSAVRVDAGAPPGPFTIECWIKGREPQAGRTMGVITQGDGNGFALFWSDGGAGDSILPVGLVRTTGGLVETRATRAWPWGEWTHVALCFDGRESRLYVGGKLQSRASAPGSPSWSASPLFIGSSVSDDGNPDDYFIGRLDDVRLSDVARYDADFTPPTHLEADTHTRTLLRFDARVSGVFPDSSSAGAPAWGVGSPVIDTDDR